MISVSELTTEAELRSYLAMRQQVYAQSGYLASSEGLDLDPFDLRSRFVGAFVEGRLIGGARLITQHPAPTCAILRELAGGLEAPSLDFFSEKIFDFRPHLQRRLYPGQAVVEFGRTVCASEHRGSGFGRALIYALHGLALNLGAAYGIACAPPHLVPYYQAVGGRVLDRQGCRHEDLTVTAIPLLVDLTRARVASRLAHEAARRLREHGALLLCESEECLLKHDHQGLPAAELIHSRQAAEPVYDWNPPDVALSLLNRPFELHDETLRDGLQSASVRQPDLVGKLEILHAIAQLGVRSANVGIPCAGPRVAADVLRLVEEIVEQDLDIVPVCAARTLAADVDPILTVADRTGCAMEVGMFLGTSPIRQLAESWDIDELVRLTREGVSYAADRGLEVMFVTEDTIRSRPEHLRRLYSTAVECGARRVCLCDTVGQANPGAVRRLVRYVRSFLPREIGVDWHGHNDRGLAVPNTLAALEAGADRVHATALGVGERAGNTAMELLMLQLLRRLGRPLDMGRLQTYLDVVARELELSAVPAWLTGKEVA